MPQGGVAAVEQRLCSGGAMGRGVFRVRGGDAWVDGCREAVGGLIKGKPGISGMRAWRSHSGDRGGSLLHGRGARRKEEAK